MDNKGHTWITDSTGNIDIFMYDNGHYCNGPQCSVCGYSFCQHCLEEPSIECPGRELTEDEYWESL